MASKDAATRFARRYVGHIFDALLDQLVADYGKERASRLVFIVSAVGYSPFVPVEEQRSVFRRRSRSKLDAERVSRWQSEGQCIVNATVRMFRYGVEIEQIRQYLAEDQGWMFLEIATSSDEVGEAIARRYEDEANECQYMDYATPNGVLMHVEII